MDPTGLQRRRFPRFHTSLAATVYVGTKAVSAHISQISRGGCLISPPLPAQETSAIKLSFRLAEDVGPVNCIGEIVYNISDLGTGVAFTEISLYNQDLITEFFSKQPAAEEAAGS
ncbi:MAG: PilZ domain-containing protein [Acidobacteria bacterium]|nr:PilZ domain-containing protein [Acidobacteriota bacterium]MBI1983691.1 PilZ domain-containing protein [Acidobacteriota bacterium]